MKKLIVVLLIVSVVAPSVFADEKEKPDPYQSRLQGEMDAKMLHKGAGWGALGFAGSLILGLLEGWGGLGGIVGTGGIIGIAALSNTNPKSMPDGDEVDLLWYAEGYRRQAKLNRMKRAAIGGGIGTVATLVIAFTFIMFTS